MARVNVDLVPVAARPPEVEQTIVAAAEMRERARQAAEAVAAAQHAVDEREREDVEAAAARARAGQPLGAPSRPLEKARADLLLKQRDLNALRLAQEQTEDAVAQAVGTHVNEWAEPLQRTTEQARARAIDALDHFEHAALEITHAAGAEAWLRSVVSEKRFDRPAPTMVIGTIAPSSRRVTANSAPLHVPDLITWLREALEPPTPTPAIVET
jgi:hypothetical protein